MEEREFFIKSEELKIFLERIDLVELLYIAEIVKKRLDLESARCEATRNVVQ